MKGFAGRLDGLPAKGSASLLLRGKVKRLNLNSVFIAENVSR